MVIGDPSLVVLHEPPDARPIEQLAGAARRRDLQRRLNDIAPSGRLRAPAAAPRAEAPDARGGAGSVDSTRTRAPSAAQPSAHAAALVVLPTSLLEPKTDGSERFRFVAAEGDFDAGDAQVALLPPLAKLAQTGEDRRLER